MILIIYVLLFYSNMSGQEITFQESLSKNEFQGKQVILLIFILFVMIIDRILYKGRKSMIIEL